MITDYIVELTPGDLAPGTADPTTEFIAKIGKRVARKGALDSPGFVVIPSTKPVLRTRATLNKFINETLRRLLAYWQSTDSDAISQIDYLYTDGPRVDNYYRTAQLGVGESRLIGLPNTSFFLHSDFLRIQYSAISYGRRDNVAGGVLHLYDALRLREEQGISLMDLVTIHVPARKTGTLNDRQHYCVAKMDLVNQHPEYMVSVPIVSSKMPLVLVSNRYPQDGLLHGPTPVQKRNPKRPIRRPSYLATIGTVYLGEDEMVLL